MIYQFDKADALRFADHVNIRAREKGDELIFSKCPYCGQGTKAKEKFAINLKTGQFNCFRASCGAHGNMITLSKDFDFQISEEVDRYFNRNNWNSRFRTFAAKHKESTNKAIEYMQSRGISEKVCKEYEITSKDGQDNVIVFPFYNEKNELKFIKYRNTEYQKGISKGSKEWCESDCMPILFGINHCSEGGQLIITEGQIDSLSVIQAGLTNAVSVPTGAQGSTWVPHCYDWIQKFDEIVIFGDCEKGKITLTEMIQSRFSNKKIRIVRIEDYQGYKDANEILQNLGGNAVVQAVNNAETVLSERVIDMASVEYKNFDEIPRIPTGFKELDRVLKGGFMFGTVVLLTGQRGNGKSTIGSQFVCEALKAGHNAFMYSGELPNFWVKDWINVQLFGKQRLTNSEIEQCENFYRGRLYLYNADIIETDEMDDLLKVVEDTIIKKDIKFVLLDNLMTALESDYDETLYRKQSNFVGRLAKLSKALQVVIVLIAHPRKRVNSGKYVFENDDVSGSGDITNKVDTIMSYDKPKESDLISENHRILRVTKNRLWGWLTKIDLFYSDDSRRTSENANDFRRDYLGDNNDSFQQMSDVPDDLPF